MQLRSQGPLSYRLTLGSKMREPGNEVDYDDHVVSLTQFSATKSKMADDSCVSIFGLPAWWRRKIQSETSF